MYAGFTDRGTLVEGAPADLFVYDFDKLGISDEEEVHDYPANEWRLITHPLGLHYVIVNGEVTMDHDKETGTPSGKLLRRRSAPALAS
jgi:N-acyl-D-aspartate/D-glutamate deacylase